MHNSRRFVIIWMVDLFVSFTHNSPYATEIYFMYTNAHVLFQSSESLVHYIL